MKNSPTESEKQPKADERNLVAINDAYKEASFEDKVFLFWQKYSSLIIGGVVLIVLFFILFQVFAYVRERIEAGIQQSYAVAETTEEKVAFARENSGHRLGGVAFLEVADEYFVRGDYGEAAGFYAEAANGLDGVPALSGRAKIGQGMSLILSERGDEGRSVLQTAAADESHFRSIRAEAYYHLAVLAADEGDMDSVTELQERIAAVDFTGVWTNRAAQLSR